MHTSRLIRNPHVTKPSPSASLTAFRETRIVVAFRHSLRFPLLRLPVPATGGGRLRLPKGRARVKRFSVRLMQFCTQTTTTWAAIICPGKLHRTYTNPGSRVTTLVGLRGCGRWRRHRSRARPVGDSARRSVGNRKERLRDYASSPDQKGEIEIPPSPPPPGHGEWNSPISLAIQSVTSH